MSTTTALSLRDSIFKGLEVKTSWGRNDLKAMIQEKVDEEITNLEHTAREIVSNFAVSMSSNGAPRGVTEQACIALHGSLVDKEG